MSLRLTSGAFQNEGAIPDKHSKQGGNVSPPLSWTGVPEGTTSLALIVDDPDAPSGPFVHWLVYGIPPSTTRLQEHLPPAKELPNRARRASTDSAAWAMEARNPPVVRTAIFFICTRSIPIRICPPG